MYNFKNILSYSIQTCKLKIIDKNRLVFIIISTSLFILYNLYVISKYSYTYKINLSMYNFILYVLNDYINISYIFTSGFLLLIIDLSNFKVGESFIIFRNKSRSSWYMSKICSIIISSIFFVTTIVVACIIAGYKTMKFNNRWDESILRIQNSELYARIKISRELVTNITPLQGVLLAMSLIILYLVLIGILNFIINLIVKNTFQGFFLTQIFMVICLLAYKKQFFFGKFYNFTTLKNLLIKDISFESFNNIIFCFLYFIGLILLLVMIGLRSSKKLDFEISDSVN